MQKLLLQSDLSCNFVQIYSFAFPQFTIDIILLLGNLLHQYIKMIRRR